MANQQWVSLLNGETPFASGAGTVLNTATTATISPTTGIGATNDVAQVNGPGQYLGWYAGLLLRVTARGFITTTGTSTTATFLLAANKVSSSSYVTLATSAGITTTTTTMTGLQWRLEALVRCTAVASSGNTVSTQGEMNIAALSTPAAQANPQTITSTATGVSVFPLPLASGETAAAVDTTQAQFICMRGTLAGANATIQLTQWLVEALD